MLPARRASVLEVWTRLTENSSSSSSPGSGLMNGGVQSGYGNVNENGAAAGRRRKGGEMKGK